MRGTPPHYRCLTMHAERLERERVWSHTDDLLRRLEHHGGRATLFVHPFSAIEAGSDLGPKIRSLIERGHEIAQHTHYYAPRRVRPADPTAKPVGSVDGANVVRCLDRDLAYLREAGADPRGFVAGGWVITTAAIDWLHANGFAYDSSFRSFALAYRNPGAVPGDGWTRPSADEGVVRLPTTTPITRWFRRSTKPLPIGVGKYDLAYIHDYDLLRLSRRATARTLVARWRSGPWKTAAEIAELVGSDIAPEATRGRHGDGDT